MALAAPALVTVAYGQDVDARVALSSYPAGGIGGWTVAATLRAYDGGPVLATGTAVPTDTGTAASWDVTFTAADTARPPGAYVWDFERTDSGSDFPICDTSAFRVTAAGKAPYPTLTNLSELWAHLKYTPAGTPADDVRYRQDLQILCAAEAFVHRYCGRRQFFYGTYTEYLDVPLRGNLFVREPPIWSIVGVNYDATGGYGQLANTFGPDTLLDGTADYFYRIDNPDGKSYSGEIFTSRRAGWGYWWGGWAGVLGWGTQQPGLLNRRPNPTPGGFKVTYVGGYATIPDDLKSAVWQIVADRRAAALLGNVMTSESMEGYSYSLGMPDQEVKKIGSVASILRGYRRGEVLFG
jgi:hypothetical protein